MRADGLTAPLAAGEAIELSVLAELTADLARLTDLDEIARTLALRSKWLIPNERCTLLVLDDDGHEWRLLPDAESGSRADLPSAIATALDTASTVVVDDARRGDLSGPPYFVAGMQSAVVLPLVNDGVPFGTLNLSASLPNIYPRLPSAVRTLLQLHVAVIVVQARNVQSLRRLNELKTRLLADVSHDYKNPLTTIVGMTDLLLAGLVGPDEMPRMLTLIRDEALRLNRLVNEVLEWSRMPFQNRGAREPVDLKAIADYCIRATGSVRDTKHHFVADYAEELPAVIGDASRLTQLFLNLIGNAAKYSPSGGDVTIRISTDPDRSRALVAIQDSGIGIRTEDLHSLFDPFMRTKSAISSGIAGHGLGLAICKEIVEQHNGRIWAESGGTGAGSTFFVSLPAAG